MLENIKFEDSGEKVSVTIDNESIELPLSKNSSKKENQFLLPF